MNERAFRRGVVITALSTASFIIIGHSISMWRFQVQEFAGGTDLFLFAVFIGQGISAAIAVIGIGVSVLAIKDR